MGIFDALNTAVGGLQAQSFALQNISGNIANASTTGYKGIDTSFEDLIPDSDDAQQAGRRRRDRLRASDHHHPGHRLRHRPSATNMAINGDGFFSVQKPTGDRRQRADLQRRHRLHPPRRFPGQCQRQSRQRRRLLPDGRRGRSEDRQPARQRSDGAAVSEQFHSGAGHHRRFNMPRTCRPAATHGQFRGARRHDHRARAASTPPISHPIRLPVGTPAPPSSTPPSPARPQ